MVIPVSIWLTDVEIEALRQRADRSESLSQFCDRLATAAVQREIGLGLKAIEARKLIESGAIEMGRAS